VARFVDVLIIWQLLLSAVGLENLIASLWCWALRSTWLTGDARHRGEFASDLDLPRGTSSLLCSVVL